jgi:hypothetical protein
LNWEDWPPLSTQPIGVQSDGSTVVMLHPTTLPDQLLTISSGDTPTPPPPSYSLGAAITLPYTGTLTDGWYVLVSLDEPGEAEMFETEGGIPPYPGGNWNAFPLLVA